MLSLLGWAMKSSVGFFLKAEEGIRDDLVTGFRRVLFRSPADEGFLNRYARQLSVGQAQRVLIAMAILHKPRLLIADEPTSALDAITQSEILALFRSLSRHLTMPILFISPNLLPSPSPSSLIP